MQWRAVPAADAADVAVRLRTLGWSWQMADAPEICALFGWQALSSRPRRIILDTGLGPDSGSIQAKDGGVMRIEVQVTDFADDDPAGRAQVREAFEAVTEAMSGRLGAPTAQPDRSFTQLRWAGPETTLLLQLLPTSVWLSVVTNARLAADDRNVELHAQGLL